MAAQVNKLLSLHRFISNISISWMMQDNNLN